MEKDENRYNNSQVEFKRTFHQNTSNQAHDIMALDTVDWETMSKDKLVVLDLRCGDGKSTIKRFGKYLNNVDVIVGIDSSEGKIEEAKKLQHYNPKFDFHCLDLDSSNISSQLDMILIKHQAEKFGIVFGGYVLIHLSDPRRLISKLANLIKDGGYIFFQEPDDSGKICYPNEEILNDIIINFNALPWIEDRFFGKKVPDLLHSTGFTDIKCFYNTIDNLNMSVAEKHNLFEITFSHRRSNYDCVSDDELLANKCIAQKLDSALDIMQKLFLDNNFYYAETRYIYSARKIVDN